MVIGGSTRGSNRSNKVKKKPKQKIEGLSISQYYQMQINICSKICIVILIYWLNLDYFSISQNSFYTKLLKTKSGWGGGGVQTPRTPPVYGYETNTFVKSTVIFLQVILFLGSCTIKYIVHIWESKTAQNHLPM